MRTRMWHLMILAVMLGVCGVSWGQKASNPNPADGAENVAAPLFLWTPGSTAVFHDVYLGKTSELGPANLVGSRQRLPMLYYVAGLEPGVTYYWRVDEIEKDGITIITGEVWTFTTLALTAHNPDPADGATIVSLTPILKWLPGEGTAQHRVYFSDSQEAVAQAAASADKGLLPLTTTTFTPGSLQGATTYYWRVDEILAGGIVRAGAVWSFTVAAKTAPWTPLVPGTEPGATHRIRVGAQDDTGITVETEVPGMFSTSVLGGGQVFQKLTIPQAKYVTAVGQPMVPVIRAYLEVPYGVNLTVEIADSKYTTLDGINVYPVQPPLPDGEDADKAEFVIDEKTYSTDTFYPGDKRAAEETILIRGHRILPLVLSPVQFNPVRKQLRVYTQMKVRVTYDRPARVEGIESRLEADAFEAVCQACLLNYKKPSLYPVRRFDSFKIPGADYLIITDGGFATAIQPLVDWKTRRGLRVKVVRTTDISFPVAPTSDDIATYIQKAYDTWNPAPTYVLLVGDSEFIPTNYRTIHPYHGTLTGTDLYYGTVDGTDYFPDIFVGRMSVDTAAQASTIVGKIVDYEKNPPATSSFYNNASVCAYFEDTDGDGQEERRFVLTSEEIRDFLVGQGYTVQRIYNADPGVAPTDDYNGDPLPAGITWTGNAAKIIAAFNAGPFLPFNPGRFLITHRDHGQSQNDPGAWLDGWVHPQFTVANVPSLTNVDRYPVVFSINCETGWFDGETDAYSTRSFECLCEELLRRSNGGAVAAIGSTRVSYGGYNDDLARGMIDAVWPTFDPVSTTGAIYELGQVLTYGKVSMAVLQPGSGGTELTEFEDFHLFGDPEMRIWTAVPRTLTVTHPSVIGSGSVQEFVVKVRDAFFAVPNVAVALVKGNEVRSVGSTDPSGNVVFQVSPITGGAMTITATAHNYRPYQGTITVTSQGAKITVTPSSGPSGSSCTITGSNFAGGETVTLRLGGVSVASVAASGGGFSTTRVVPSLPEGFANVVATGQTSGRVGGTVFRVLPPQPEPYSYSQWDSSTWSLASGQLVWDSPSIQLREQSTGNVVASNNLRIGTTYTIEARIYNHSTQAANGTRVTFTWALWSAGQVTWNFISTDTVNVPASPGSVVAKAMWTPIVTAHVCIRAEIDHPLDSNLANNLGQENTTVLAISSPAEVKFDVHNPTKAPGLVRLEVGQGDVAEASELWATRIDQPSFRTLAPGESQTVTLRVVAPDGAKIGDSRVLNITGTIGGEVIGGIQVTVVKDHPPTLAGASVNPGQGPVGTSFRYRVIYADSDNHPPLQKNPLLHVSKAGQPVAGSPFVMREEDAKDTVYKDGKAYICDVALPQSGRDYLYSFQASDALGVDGTGSATVLMSGPVMTEK